jgi:hypothetical protein
MLPGRTLEKSSALSPALMCDHRLSSPKGMLPAARQLETVPMPAHGPGTVKAAIVRERSCSRNRRVVV